MRRIPFIMGGALGLCVAATVCNADWLKIKYTGTGSAGDSNGATIYYDGPEGNIATGWVGLMGYEVDGVGVTELGVDDSGDTGSQWEYLEGTSFQSFCTEIQEYTNGSWQTLEIKKAKDLPIDGGYMGEQRADLLSALFISSFESDGWTNVEAAAFQACLWEIAFESGFVPDAANYGSSGLGVGGGGLSFVEGSTSTKLITGSFAQAASYLTAAWNLWQDEDFCHNSLWGVDTEDWQGMIIPIPLPAPFALAGVGLLGVLAGRRKLARLVK